MRVGGKYRLGFLERSTGKENIVGGEYLEIARPEKLVFSWTWEPPNENAGIETLVTIRFAPVDGGTELTLLHEKFPRTDMRDHHHWGWTGAIDRLSTALG